MFNDMRSVKVRRLLYLASAALVVIAVGVRIWLGGFGKDEVIAQTARELTSTIAGAVIVWTLGIAFIRFFFAKESQSHETQVIDGDASAKRFLLSASNATIWFHHGQIGRWVRENALPNLVLRSTQSSEPLRLIVILLDPRVDEICKAHADRRNSRRRKESTDFTAEHIKCEIAATVLSLAKATAMYPNFKANVYVSKLDLPFRIDLCDDYGYITHEDQTAPAFGFEKKSPYFATTRGYFEKLDSTQFTQVNLDLVRTKIEKLDKTSLTEILSILDLNFSRTSEKKVATKILRFVKKVV